MIESERCKMALKSRKSDKLGQRKRPSSKSASKSQSGSRKRQSEENSSEPKKIKLAQSQKQLQFSSITNKIINNSNFSKLIEKKESIIQTEVHDSGRIGQGHEWKIGSQDSFLNQKFPTNSTKNAMKKSGSPRSFIKSDVANIVSQSIQTSSMRQNLNTSIRHSSVRQFADEATLIQEEGPAISLNLSNHQYPCIPHDHLKEKNNHVEENSVHHQRQMSSQQQPFTRVFVMGETKYGQLGFTIPNIDSGQQTVIKIPKMCSYNILIKQIACGEAHTHILSQDGYVYSMGKNHYGVLGLSVNEQQLQSVTEPQLITTLSSITQISTGRAHSLALAANRNIFAWGRQENGAISIRIACTSVPAILDFNLTAKKGSNQAQVIKVASGLEHSMFLTNDGEVYGCGEGEHGQLGLGYCSLIEYRPIKIRFKELIEIDYITDVACGNYHTLFVSKHHQVFSCGLNNIGQLGLGCKDQKVYVPQLINDLVGRFITNIVAGESSFALNDQGDMFVWGFFNQQVFQKPFIPSSVNEKVLQVSQSYYGLTSLIDFENRLWVWNSNSQNSQNLLELESYPQQLRSMRNKIVTQTFSGRDIVFALGEDLIPGQVSPPTKPFRNQKISPKEEQKVNNQAKNTEIKNPLSDLKHKNMKMPELNLSRITSIDESPQIEPLKLEIRSKRSSQSKSLHRKKNQKLKKSSTSKKIAKKRKDSSEIRINKSEVSKSQSRSKSRELQRNGYSRLLREKKSVSLSRALKQINRADLKSKSKDTKQNLISKKFCELQRKLDEDGKKLKKLNYDLEKQNSKRQKSRSKRNKSKKKSEKSSDDMSPIKGPKVSRISKVEDKPCRLKRHRSQSHSQNKSQNQKQSKSRASRSKSRASSDSRHSNLQKSIQLTKNKPIAKNMSVDILVNQNKTVEANHKYDVLSPCQNVTVSPIANNVSVKNEAAKINFVIDELDELPDNEKDSSLIQTKKSSLKPFSDSQYQVQNQALENYQENAKTQMQKLYKQIDQIKEENSNLKQILDLQKHREQVQREELIKTKEIQSSQSFNADKTLSSVESKLRTSQIENETLKLQKSDAERKIAQLEDRIQKLQMSKNKEDDYLAQLGKSCETIRKERNHNKDLQNEVQSLTKALTIVEATLSQVKQDRVRLEYENKNLEEQLQEKQNYQITQSQAIKPYSQLSIKESEEDTNLLSKKDMKEQKSDTCTQRDKETNRQNCRNYQFSQETNLRSQSVEHAEPISHDRERQSSRNLSNHSYTSSRSGSRSQIIQKLSQKSQKDEEWKHKGRDPPLVDQFFKRSQEGLEELSKRSAQNSRPQKRQCQISEEKSVKPGTFIQEKLGIVEKQSEMIRSNANIARIHYETKLNTQIANGYYDTKESKETGRFVDSQNCQFYDKSINSAFDNPRINRSPNSQDLSMNFAQKKNKSQAEVIRHKNLNSVVQKASKEFSKQSSPLRITQNDQSRHQNLRLKDGSPSVNLSNDQIEDQNSNSLNRFAFIHKRSGDTCQNLERDQKYSHFPPTEEDQEYNQQSSSSVRYNHQDKCKDLSTEREQSNHTRNPTMMRQEDFTAPADYYPVSLETQKQFKALKADAIKNHDISEDFQESRRNLRQPSKTNTIGSQNEQLHTCQQKLPSGLDYIDNRQKPEDFKTFAPSMRYRDDSPEGKRNIQKLSGLNKENLKPEDRLAKEEQYNQMLLSNLEKLAEKKKEAIDLQKRTSKSRDSRELFVNRFDLADKKMSSPIRSNFRSSGGYGPIQKQYKAINNSQPYHLRRQNIPIDNQMKAGYSLDLQERKKSAHGSLENSHLSNSQNQSIITAFRKQTNPSAISDNTSNNSFLAKREALQNRLKNL